MTEDQGATRAVNGCLANVNRHIAEGTDEAYRRACNWWWLARNMLEYYSGQVALVLGHVANDDGMEDALADMLRDIEDNEGSGGLKN